jgi:hypothetical protein
LAGERRSLLVVEALDALDPLVRSRIDPDGVADIDELGDVDHGTGFDGRQRRPPAVR